MILADNDLMVSNIKLSKVKSSVVEEASAVGAILYAQLLSLGNISFFENNNLFDSEIYQ